MLINALCRYDDLRKANDTKKLPDGWENVGVHYCIVLSPDGKIERISPIKEPAKIPDKKGKEKTVYVPREILLPKRTQKPGIDANYLEHRPLYIFGLNYDKDSGGFTPDDRTDKAKKSHQAFVRHELEFLEGLDSPICNAYRNFLQNWVPENEIENPELINLGKDYNSYFTFSLHTGYDYLCEDEQFKEKYNKIFSDKAAESADAAICGILGERLPPARLHDKINLPYGQSSGCQLVCMNSDAFNSYGKEQSFNSNISELAMQKYTSALKYLLSDDKHHMLIDKMTVIFFAMKHNDEAECQLFAENAAGRQKSEDEIANRAESNLLASGEKVKVKGIVPDVSVFEKADSNVEFYIAGFTPNGPRVCQKFIYKNTFGNIIKNMQKHQDDLRIRESADWQIYFGGIKRELVLPKKGDGKKSDNRDIPPPLMTGIMLAAFTGSKYPDAMLSTVIKRVKLDSDDENNKYIKLNDIRAGIIKACLNRKYQREVITMSWNKENKNPAYICGGLFAIYEKIQQKSAKGTLNTTIKDAYFASACSRPSTVLTKIANLSNYHMRKLDKEDSERYFAMIRNLTDDLDGGYPTTLSLDDQGCFIVGYYQMCSRLVALEKLNERKD